MNATKSKSRSRSKSRPEPEPDPARAGGAANGDVYKALWVVIGDGEGGGRCLRCGHRLRFPPACPDDCHLAFIRAFVRVHSGCVAPR